MPESLPLARPVPPPEPDPLSCCGNECGDACIWTLHRLAQIQYERDLERWQIAQLENEP